GDICSDDVWIQRTEGERTNCMHAVGHLLMYITDANIERSVYICEEIGMTPDNIDMRRMCFEGAFMQIYQPLEPDDFALIEGKAPKTLVERDALCERFSGRAKTSCVKESWPMEPESIQDGTRVAPFCKKAGHGDEAEEEYCISAVSYIGAARSQFNAGTFAAFCEEVEGRWAGACLMYGAPRFLEIHQTNFEPTISLCRKAEARGSGEACWRLVANYSTRTFKAHSREALALCAALPREWRDSCIEVQDTGSLEFTGTLGRPLNP
ncbi:MAG: hypothetical protein AAB923_01585, partial [Patescibacteria group bacterium]